MIGKLETIVSIYRPRASAIAGLLVGGLIGAFGGLFGALVGALLGFMVDRVRAALVSETPGRRADETVTAIEEGIPDPRAVLGLGPDAGPEEIRRAWRRVSKQYHPDTGFPSEAGARRFREAREAYEALMGGRGGSPGA